MTTLSHTASSAEEMAVAFARVLRGVGIVAPVDSVLTFVKALHKVGIEEQSNVYWAAHSTLIRRPEDREVFDRAFRVFWEHRHSENIEEEAETLRIELAVDDDDGDSS